MTSAPETVLAETLDALASPTRLALLRALRSPRILAEIEVRSAERAEGGALARQTIRKHLDVLLEAGLVTSRDVVRERGDTAEFVLNHQAIYALAEDVRDLARMRPLVEVGEMTADVRAAGARTVPRGPSLVLVKGLDEGTSFDLAPDPPRRTSWVIGRRRGVEVPLDFDPYISSENSRVVFEDGAHHIETLPSSRNGTLVNFRALAAGDRHRLAHGDIIGVGRSVLAYWA